MATMQPREPAFHGYAPPNEADVYRPPLSIVISRETGARGRSIAERVAEIMGWSYLDQESLEYLTQGPPAGNDGRIKTIDPAAEQWIKRQLDVLNQDGSLLRSPHVTSLVRGILTAVCTEQCVILGRGAGRVIPREARLHVKIIAPMEERVAFIEQMNRLSPEHARQFVIDKDRAREQFLAAKLGVPSSDLSLFDMVLNTAEFGVEASAQIVANAASSKEAHLKRGWQR